MMKVIIKGKPNITALLGKQHIKDTEYRMMHYVLISQCEDGILLHNAITGNLVLLDKDEKAILDSLPCKHNDKMDELVAGYFIVPKEFNEKKIVETLRTIIKRFDTPKGVESYTILTTTNCNARCFYCYENNLPRINMTKETADELANYMDEKRGQVKTLKLHWFGGEPLVCMDRIDQICEKLCAKGIDYVSSMTSNGYLFTEETVKKAVSSWKLKSIQITLDGTEDIYNNTKRYISAAGSPYQRVLKNIQLLLANDVHVIIRLNLDKHNSEDLNRLVSELNNTIKNRGNIEIYSHVLFEDAGFAPIERDEEDREMLYERQIELNRIIENLGLGKNHRSVPFLKTHHCMADTNSAVVVYPDGRLFKCEHVAMEDECGSIFTGETNDSAKHKFFVTTELDTCSHCPLYPSCILLKHCQGVHDKNELTCKSELEFTIRSMKEDYYHARDNKIRILQSSSM